MWRTSSRTPPATCRSPRMEKIMRKPAVALALVAFSAAGCTTTPTAPPALDLPAGTGVDPALERWWTDFNDPTLTALVDEALTHNLDLRAAIARIDLARAQVKLAQKDLYPSVNLEGAANRTKASEVGPFPLFGAPPTTNDFKVEVNASYEVDLWGKFRTATRAAQDDLLASQYARETVRTVIGAEVAQTYFQLLAADAQLKLLDDTLKSRTETVGLQRDRYQGGVIGEYDLAQSEAERAAVVADIAGTRRAIAQYESALAPLLGLKAIEANVEAKTAQRDQTVISYQQTVQTAFKETHDALNANQTTREALAAQSERANRLKRAVELADLRYRSGYSPYLEVLDAQRQLLQAQTLQINAARDVRLAVVDLAKAMGGGWEYSATVVGS